MGFSELQRMGIDTLAFIYSSGNHDVAEVTKAGLDACNALVPSLWRLPTLQISRLALQGSIIISAPFLAIERRGDIEAIRGRMNQLLKDFDCFSTASIFSTKSQQQNN
ncbi:hypothetical protein ACFX1W_024177 [Malus domestica]